MKKQPAKFTLVPTGEHRYPKDSECYMFWADDLYEWTGPWVEGDCDPVNIRFKFNGPEHYFAIYTVKQDE